jgi:hypothetical protein
MALDQRARKVKHRLLWSAAACLFLSGIVGYPPLRLGIAVVALACVLTSIVFYYD